MIRHVAIWSEIVLFVPLMTSVDHRNGITGITFKW